jgi:hypothetical protein
MRSACAGLPVPTGTGMSFAAPHPCCPLTLQPVIQFVMAAALPVAQKSNIASDALLQDKPVSKGFRAKAASLRPLTLFSLLPDEAVCKVSWQMGLRNQGLWDLGKGAPM